MPAFSYYQMDVESFGLSPLDLFPGQTEMPFTVTGVARDGAPSHYDIQDNIRGAFPEAVFDSEAGTFFAYAPNELVAQGLTAALNAMYGDVPSIPAPSAPAPFTATVSLTKADVGYLWGLVQAAGDLTIEASHARRILENAADVILANDEANRED